MDNDPKLTSHSTRRFMLLNNINHCNNIILTINNNNKKFNLNVQERSFRSERSVTFRNDTKPSRI